MFRISVVITTHRRDRELKRTLESIASCAIPDCNIDIYVIENGHKGNAAMICKEVKCKAPIQHIYLEKPGTSNAKNNFVGTLRDDRFIVFFDDDVIIGEGTLEAYHVAFEKFGAGYFYGGPIHPEYEVQPSLVYLELFPFSVKGFVPFSNVTVTNRPLFLGANWAAFSADILSAGNFHPELGPGGALKSTGHEEYMQRRLLAKGCSGVYVPDAKVWHFVPKSTMCFSWLKERYYKNGLRAGLDLRWDKCTESGKIPRWLVRKLATDFLLIAIHTIGFKRNISYFSRKLEFQRTLGMISVFLRRNK